MFRILLVAVGLVPVGWCRKGTRAPVWRNRRGGRVVLLADVAANVGELLRAFLFRLPPGSEFVRGKDGKIRATINRDGRDAP